MKRLLLLIGVVLSIVFSTPFTMIGAIAIAANDNISNYSTAQEDLNNFNLIESDYILDPESNRQVSCFLFAEDIEEDGTYYYLYLYDPKGFTTIPATSYSQIQISHLTSNELELLNDEEAVERALNYYDLTYLSSSDNGTVAKFLVNDLKFSTPKSYRRYQIRQISYYYNNQKNHFTLGDEYLYETLSDGSISYQYKKMDYITLYNIILDSYAIDVVLDSPSSNLIALDKLASFLGGEFYLGKYDYYGFSLPKDLEIDDLISVDFSYYKYDYVFYKPGVDFDKAEIFSYTNGFDGSTSKYNPVKSNPIYYPEVTINDYEVIGNIDNKWFGTQKNNWNTISTYDNLKNISNDEMRVGLMETFKNCEYIVNYAASPCYSKPGTFAYALNSDKSLYDPFVYALADYDENVSSIYNGGYYTYSKYTTTYYSNVEAVKLTLNSEGKIYDLAVIVAPKDAPDDIKGANPNPSVVDKLIELLKKFVKWIQDNFNVSEGIAWIIAILSIFISGSVVISLLVGLFKVGITKVITALFSGLWAIITFPFNLLFGNKKEKDKYYTHNNYYEKRDKS